MTQLSFSASPQIIEFEFPSLLKADGSASVLCSVKSGSPPLKFEWLKDGIPLRSDDKLSIFTTGDLSSLTFRQLRRSDPGNYTCIVKNEEAMDSHTAQLFMRCKLTWLTSLKAISVLKSLSVSPEWTSKPVDQLKSREGSDVHIECSASGEPKPSVTIFKHLSMKLVAFPLCRSSDNWEDFSCECRSQMGSN